MSKTAELEALLDSLAQLNELEAALTEVDFHNLATVVRQLHADLYRGIDRYGMGAMQALIERNAELQRQLTNQTPK
jgi:hypothetical protein